MRTLAIIACLGFWNTSVADADNLLDSVQKRFSLADQKEIPSLRKHVSPLFGKLGCNGRACHGSFQGRGGFRLSLFGYDFKLDHDSLTKGKEPRVDVDFPEGSLMIEKPTLTQPHKGGKRLKVDSWQYRLLINWIKGGAKPVPYDQAAFVKLEVTPKEIVFQNKGEQRQMKAVAVWADGMKEDVTPLCRFQSNDTSVATIDANGLVTAKTSGDTHVVLFYDQGVVPIPVMKPISNRIGSNFPHVATPTKVDKLVVEKLKKLGIVPSELSTDQEFLRRVRIDLTGTLPSPQEVKSFLEDRSTFKRKRKIDELLESPAYVSWWTTKLCDFTGNSDDALVNVTPVRGKASQEWYDWIHKRVENNTPYVDIAEGIILSTSRKDGQSFEEYSKEMSDLYRKNSEEKFEDRDDMPYYWARRTFRRPEERVIGFAYNFLGIHMQCATCHKHPFDRWTQDDFKQFRGFFANTTFGRNPQSRQQYQTMLKDLDLVGKKGNIVRRELPKLLNQGKTIPFQEVYTIQPRKPNRKANNRNRRKNRRRNRGRGATSAKILAGETIDLTEQKDSRQPLMDWLRDPKNPYFAKAFVNRVWASYFNVGIVEPADNLSLANPPSNGPLLNYLTQGFIENGYDMKWLHREIANSRTYQLGWKPTETNAKDLRNFSHSVPRRIPAEVAFDAMRFATSSDTELVALQNDPATRAITIPGAGRRYRGRRTRNNNIPDPRYAMTVFGRSTRDNNCDCDRSFDPSLIQTAYLYNDRDVQQILDRRQGGWLRQVAAEWKIPFRASATPQRRGRKRPANYKKTVANFKKRIRALRKARNPQKLRKVQRQLNAYYRRFGRDNRNKKTASGVKNKLKSRDYRKVIEQSYLRTLSRYPTEKEMETSKAYIQKSQDIINGVRGLMWALLNTKEFIVNH